MEQETIQNDINLQESTQEKRVDLGNGKWVMLKETEKGIYEITDENLTDKDGNNNHDLTCLGISIHQDGVVGFEDLDTSNEQQYIGTTDHVRVGNVKIDILGRTAKIEAPSFEEAKNVIQKLGFEAYCPGDI